MPTTKKQNQLSIKDKGQYYLFLWEELLLQTNLLKRPLMTKRQDQLSIKDSLLQKDKYHYEMAQYSERLPTTKKQDQLSLKDSLLQKDKYYY